MKMQLDTLTQEDLYGALELQPDDWGGIQPALDFYTRADFCFPVKVSIAGRIVGIGTRIHHEDVAWLAHIIVHRDFRRQGIGLQITKHLVAAANSNTIYLLATNLGAPVYEKAGFVTEAEYLFFKDVNPLTAVADPFIQPYHARYEQQIAHLDWETSGERRFFHLQLYLKDSFVYVAGDKVLGFFLPGLGDGLIIADNEAAGLALMQKRMENSDKAVFPANNELAKQFLHGIGAKEVSVGKRMRLGAERKLKLQNIYNRIGGNLG